MNTLRVTVFLLFLLYLSGMPHAAPARRRGHEPGGQSSQARGTVYVNLFMHNEDNVLGDLSLPATKTAYLRQRALLIDLLTIIKRYGIPFNYQSDWKFLLAIAEYDTPDITTTSNGKNLLRFLKEDLNITIDPHSHESQDYNYTDVAYLIGTLGVTPTNVIGGHIWDPYYASYQNWERFKYPLRGSKYPAGIWKGDILIGSGTPNHVNDPQPSGVWRPLEKFRYWEDDPYGNVYCVGQYVGSLAGVQELAALYAKGAVPADRMLTTSIIFHQRDLAPAAIANFEDTVLKPLLEMQSRGEVKIATFVETVNDWKSKYGSQPYVYNLRTPVAIPLCLPRLVSTASESTGIALVNPTESAANISFSAYEDSGRLVPVAAPIKNPFSVGIPPRSQWARVASEMFGESFNLPGGWMEIASDRLGAAAFFLAYDPLLRALDGTDISNRLYARCILPEIPDSEIAVANPRALQPANITLQLVADSGQNFGLPLKRLIPSRGRLAGMIQDLFPSGIPARGGYLSISSSIPVSVLERFGIPGIHASMLNALDADSGSRQLYAPQYVSGGGYASSITIINLEGWPTALSLSWLDDDGKRIGKEIAIQLPAASRVQLDSSDAFGATIPAAGLQGYLKIGSSDTRITGSVKFGDPAGTQFQTALPLCRRGYTDALYAQLANNETYFTGVAAANPNADPARVTITLFSSSGTLFGQAAYTIPPNGRLSRLLSQIVPELPPMSRGYFRLSANVPIVSFAVFGTHSLTALSAIPPQ